MITPRLNCIINHVKYRKIADIGTDHAYIPIKLAQQNLIDYAIASDVNKGPADIAKSNIKKYNLTGKIEVRIGSGLSPLKIGEVDEIIIAGMGGVLISQIIDNNLELAKSCKNLILQPMNSQYELRKYLIKNGFSIVNEDLAIEYFKVYNVFEAQNTVCNEFFTEIDYHIPKTLLNHKYIQNLKEKKYKEFTKILTGLNNSKNKDINQIKKYESLLTELNSII